LCTLEHVDRKPVFCAEPAVAAANGETTDTGVVYSTADSRETVLGGFFIYGRPERATADGDGALRGVDGDGTEVGEIDDETTLGRGCAGARVSTALDGELKAVGSCVFDLCR
jgi:hypothetical protein